LRCGFEAVFFAAASFAGFLPSIDISISFWPLAALRGFFEGFDSFAGSAPPTLRRSASMRSTTLPAAGRSFFVIGWPARFLLMRSTSAASYWSSNRKQS
jgi:hypothetical protein